MGDETGIGQIQEPVERDDLSEGKLSGADKAVVNLGIKEQEHRFAVEQTLFSSALCFVALLYITAVVFGGIVLYQLGINPTMHWHASVLVAAFVVPPTVIMVSLLRAVYRSGEKAKDEEKKKDDEFPLPTFDLARDIAKEVGKAVGHALTKR